ncbi:hypothetical protein SAMN05216316_1219 [Nitrosovibrio sp. Nv6]|nr:hypothetical protein SAMN05216316_1219 [Nitrosovibrio sp. Nv6]
MDSSDISRGNIICHPLQVADTVQQPGTSYFTTISITPPTFVAITGKRPRAVDVGVYYHIETDFDLFRYVHFFSRFQFFNHVRRLFPC